MRFDDACRDDVKVEVVLMVLSWWDGRDDGDECDGRKLQGQTLDDERQDMVAPTYW
jgi:hypothetical protein